MKKVLACIGGIVSVLVVLYLSIFLNELRKPNSSFWFRRGLSLSIYEQKCSDVAPVDKPIRFTVEFDGIKYMGTSDNLIDAEILRCGAWEKPILYFLRDTAKAIGRPVVFVDVGANIGQHSLFMSKYAAEVHAFEPFPPVLQRFRDMIALNGIQNIQVHPVGLGNENAKLPFYSPPANNLGAGSFVAGPGGSNKVPDLTLKIVKGDEEFERDGIQRVDLIKMDIEGYEKLALQGLAATLRKYRPIVVMEITVDPQSEITFKSEADLEQALPDGYHFLIFDRNGWDPGLGHYLLRELNFNFTNYGHQDLVLYPSEKRSDIRLSNF